MDSRLRILFEKYFNKQASPEEERELFELLQREELQKSLEALLEETYLDYEQKERFFNAKQTSRMLKRIKQQTVLSPRVLWYRIGGYAAVILVCLGLGLFVYSYLSKSINTSSTKKTVVKRDVEPGFERATITLADGQTLELEEIANGIFADRESRFVKEGEGRLNYSGLEKSTKETVFHTMRVPKGGQYRVVLADGTKVWLNAASSLHYPTRFDGDIREVTVSGEAYFEVARNVNKPFFVNCEGQRVQVLGTDFNVRAYPDETAFKTTLLAGSIAITTVGTSSKKIRLQPGEEASLTAKGSIKVNRLKEADLAIAWTKGYFAFNRADLPSVLRELSRWYNVDLKVKSSTTKTYTGKIDRQLTLSELLNGLALSGIPIQIEDQEHIIELPKDLFK